jgi:hypothetical protein
LRKTYKVISWFLKICFFKWCQLVPLRAGFSFDGTDTGALDYALDRALDAYFNDREWWRAFQGRVMRQDWWGWAS